MTQQERAWTLKVEAGRHVAVHEVTDGERPVVLMHPAPGAGPFDPDPEVTAGRSVRLITVDRPGYGASWPRPDDEWSTVATAADDVAAALDHLGLANVGVAGWSAGGRVSLALAARRPDLVDRVVVLGTPAPHEDVPWIPEEVAAGVDALRGLPAAATHAAMSEQLAGFAAAAAADPGVALQMLGQSPGDDAALQYPGARDRLAAMVFAALERGASGLVADMAGYTLRPWGFDPGEVAAKTLLLYGSADPVAGGAHGRWWQGRLPDARLEMVPGAGHLLVIPMWKRVLSHLAPGR